MGTLQVGGTTLATKNVSTGKVDLSANYRPPAGGVIEQFASPCDGSSITVQSGTYTVEDVTSGMTGLTGWNDITGSTITYTPPTGTQTVVYKFDYNIAYEDESPQMNSKLLVDSIDGTAGFDEVVYARSDYHGWGSSYPGHGRVSFKWAFNIGGSASTNTGRVASWTSAKTIKLQMRNYTASNQMQLHQLQYWEGSDSSQLVLPIIEVTALG